MGLFKKYVNQTRKPEGISNGSLPKAVIRISLQRTDLTTLFKFIGLKTVYHYGALIQKGIRRHKPSFFLFVDGTATSGIRKGDGEADKNSLNDCF